MQERVQLKNVTLMWANLAKPNAMSGKFQVDITELNDEQVSGLKTLGIIPKVHDVKGRFITCKSTKPIIPLDSKGNTVQGLIGNGTKANVLLGSYEWKSPTGHKRGVSPSIAKLVITNLVEYAPDAIGDDDDEEI